MKYEAKLNLPGGGGGGAEGVPKKKKFCGGSMDIF